MRVFFFAIAAFILAACAAPSEECCVPLPPSHQGQNQPHLPPPNFPVSEVPTDVKFCGGMIQGQGDECRIGEFCRRTIGDMCGAADAPGRCSPLPEICPQNYAPVCGCDGRTYPNECAANSHGISASYEGECR